jgi:hypothetical protein
MGESAFATGRLQADCCHGALLNWQAPCQQSACVASSNVSRFVTPTIPPTGADANEFYRVSAPNAVPLVVTNRARNEIAPVVCRWLVGSLPRATVTGCPPKAKAAFSVASLVWRNDIRTFVAVPRGRTSQSCLLGALAAAPGSMAMLRASPAVFPSREFRGLWCVALPFHFLMNAHAVVLSNLRLS